MVLQQEIPAILVYCSEENMPVVDGPISHRIAHLMQTMKMYRLL